MTKEELVKTLQTIFGSDPWPKPLHILQAMENVRLGVEVRKAARQVGTGSAFLEAAIKAADPIEHLLGIGLHEIDIQHRDRATQILGQLLLGRCAEIAFERLYKSEMHAEEFELRDLREGRTDTDYRLHNGRGRPIYRVNIKFHGSPFRRAQELVGLAPLDCFALATYKIFSALQKQEQERLPYFFAIVGVPNLTGEAVGRQIPSYLVETVALIDQAPKGKQKRDFEDAAIESLVRDANPTFKETLKRILSAEWYMLSARRAEKLLRELLFERVFAMRLRGFSRAFRGAELDMHFSLSKDLIPLKTFLSTLRDGGQQRITTLMERGEF